MITLGMMRQLLLLLLLTSACDVGSVLAQEGGGDAGSGTDDPSACPAKIATETNTGHHAINGGSGDPGATVLTPTELAAGCMGQSGCHNGSATLGSGDGETAPAYDYGGMAFTDSTGVSPYAGGWVMLGTIGETRTYAKMEINQNGFFYLASGGTFPAPSTSNPIQSWICTPTAQKSLMATSLSTVQINAAVPHTDGNCQGNACHGNPTTSPGDVYVYPLGS